MNQTFGVTPDPRFLYLSPTHREAMASLLHGIRSGRGFAALIAPPGMGKTTLLFSLLRVLRRNAKTAFLFQTLCGPEQFLSALLADLGIENDGQSITRMQAKLNDFLFRESQNGRQVVVIVDEAQNLKAEVLELVRMLSNFETPKKKLMQLVLAGQPQLAEKLASDNLTQLRQRISIVARLVPFNAGETRAYIEHRLQVAGYVSGGPLFTNRAYAMIAEQSYGIPRNINNLCFNAMSLACALKQPKVDDSIVQEAIGDLDLRTFVPLREDRTEREDRSEPFRRKVLSFANLRAIIVSAIVLLVALTYLILQTSEPSTNRSLIEPAAAALGQKPNLEVVPANAEAATPTGAKHQPGMRQTRHSQGTSVSSTASQSDQTLDDILGLDPLLRGLGHLRQPRISESHSRAQDEQELQSAHKQNVVPFEFASQREKQ